MLSVQLMVKLREDRIGITGPSCSLVMMKIKCISSPDGWSAKLNWELSWDFGSYAVFILTEFPLILGWVLPEDRLEGFWLCWVILSGGGTRGTWFCSLSIICTAQISAKEEDSVTQNCSVLQLTGLLLCQDISLCPEDALIKLTITFHCCKCLIYPHISPSFLSLSLH